MIEINLLPGGASRRPTGPARPGGRKAALPQVPGDSRLAAAGGAVVVVFLALGFLFWRAGSQKAELEAAIGREVADSTRLAGVIALVQEMEARQDTIEQKIDVIRGVDERRYVWPHLMDEISRALPPYTWLTKLTAEEEPEPAAPPPARPGQQPDSAALAAAAAAAAAAPRGPAFTLEGNTGSTQALTRFMKNLEASPVIRDVTLVTSEQTTREGLNVLKFTLEARFEQPDPSIIETVPVVSIR